MKIFGLPVETSESMAPNEVLLAPSEIVDALRLSDAARVIARHGIIPAETADALRRHARAAVQTAIRERRAIVMTIND